jgi:hypothetical protein
VAAVIISHHGHLEYEVYRVHSFTFVRLLIFTIIVLVEERILIRVATCFDLYVQDTDSETLRSDCEV